MGVHLLLMCSLVKIRFFVSLKTLVNRLYTFRFFYRWGGIDKIDWLFCARRTRRMDFRFSIGFTKSKIINLKSKIKTIPL
jgi:hypothetical protein